MPAHCPSDADDDLGAPISIYWLRRELGRQNYGNTRLVSYVSLLIAECGFPPPLPALKVGRRARGSREAPPVPDCLEREVTLDSRWRRDAVAAWFADYLPPANAAQVDKGAHAAAAEQMDRAAEGLRLVRGGRA